MEPRTVLSASPLLVTTTADVINPTDGVLSLREAVQQLNGTPGGGHIELAAGTYTLTKTGMETADPNAILTNDLDIASDITITGAGPGITIIDASGLSADLNNSSHDRIFDVLEKQPSGPFGSLTLEGMTLTGGDVRNLSGGPNPPGTNPPIQTGGAVLVRGNDVDGGTLVLTDIAVVGNQADSGGGIRVFGGASVVEVSSSVFTGNVAQASGGAIYAGQEDLNLPQSSLEVAGSIFVGNTATNFPSVRGEDNTSTEGLNVTDNNQANGIRLFFDQPGDIVLDTPGEPIVAVTSIEGGAASHASSTSVADAVAAANPIDGTVVIPAWTIVLDETQVLELTTRVLSLGPAATLSTPSHITTIDPSGLTFAAVADFDGSGSIGNGDLNAVLANWGDDGDTIALWNSYFMVFTPTTTEIDNEELNDLLANWTSGYGADPFDETLGGVFYFGPAITI